MFYDVIKRPTDFIASGTGSRNFFKLSVKGSSQQVSDNLLARRGYCLDRRQDWPDCDDLSVRHAHQY